MFDKASEKKRNIWNFNKFCVFFLYIYITYIYIYRYVCVCVCVCLCIWKTEYWGLHTTGFADVVFLLKNNIKAHKLLKNWNHRRYWTLDVSRTASYEITLVRLSVRPSVTKFCQNCIFSFFDTVHENSWPWYLVTDRRNSRRNLQWEEGGGGGGGGAGDGAGIFSSLHL